MLRAMRLLKYMLLKRQLWYSPAFSLHFFKTCYSVLMTSECSLLQASRMYLCWTLFPTSTQFLKIVFTYLFFSPVKMTKDCLRKEDKAHTLIFVDKCRPVMSSSTSSKTIDNWSYLYSRHRIRTHLTTRLDT